MSTATPPPAAGALTDEQQHWNLIDGILNRWEALRNDYAAAMQTWDLPTFIARTFPGWEVVAVLREQGAAAACLRLDDTLIALPFTWPKGCSPAKTLGSPTGADGEPDPFAVRIIACDIDTTLDGWRPGAFDTGITESVTGTDPLAMITEAIISDWHPERLTGAPGSPLPHQWGQEPPPLRELLSIEALLIALPDADREAARMLLALRGITQRTGYDRLA